MTSMTGVIASAFAIAILVTLISTGLVQLRGTDCVPPRQGRSDGDRLL